jgi:hypothetical protein
MSDELARAVGAGDSVEVNGKTYHASPITIQELQEVQRMAIRSYKREYLQSYAENLDLLPEEFRQGKMDAKLDEVSKWDIANMPTKTAYDVSKVRFTPALEDLLSEEFGDLPETEAGKKAVLATALDAETVTVQRVEELTGCRPRKGRIPYDTWWITAKLDGIVAMAWASLHANHPELKKDEVARWPFVKLAEVARLAESLTAPDLGNT